MRFVPNTCKGPAQGRAPDPNEILAAGLPGEEGSGKSDR